MRAGRPVPPRRCQRPRGPRQPVREGCPSPASTEREHRHVGPEPVAVPKKARCNDLAVSRG
eukprot:15471196-Alexandrium_andersonii.AAC.1